ncbi:unnamed protein product [Meloidogyne enterolobii]|uniref:Uncharacterized protein n=1 Tax=Meloidogyne enterolobii TaxID=390850 RepID=A0ACB0Z083_MELEN
MSRIEKNDGLGFVSKNFWVSSFRTSQLGGYDGSWVGFGSKKSKSRVVGFE